jgi:16S rRNA C967 or C1407 C5-methylase (RsmB/RsmF family)/NOL1/NOP2/fmu family ribosome biogenesis protein
MFPERFINRILQQRYIDPESLLKALESESPVSIRVNRSKWTGSPLRSTPVPWCSDGFYLGKRPKYTLDPLLHAGCYYPQEASGMFLGQVFKQALQVHDGIRVLDICGAPGGKATHLSTLIGEEGMLVANEVIRQRTYVLSENITKWGLSNVIITRNDPSDFSSLHGFFDMILIDAPCSGEGMFRDEIAINEWSVENGAHCSERQRRIMMDVWPSLRENGILVYSTCTFNPGENEENIKWLISKQEAESVTIDISAFKGITEIDYEGIFGYGFYPGKIKGEGLFISVLRKTGKQNIVSERIKKVSDNKLTREERSVALAWTLFKEENLIRQGDTVFCFPGNNADYSLMSKRLKIVSPGTGIFTGKQNKYLPSHELAMSVYLKKNIFPSIDLDLSDSLSYMHRESISPGNSEKGWNLISYRGILLGFVNNIGNRLNNYYPVEWRIRMDTTLKVDKDAIVWNNSNLNLMNDLIDL